MMTNTYHTFFLEDLKALINRAALNSMQPISTSLETAKVVLTAHYNYGIRDFALDLIDLLESEAEEGEWVDDSPPRRVPD